MSNNRSNILRSIIMRASDSIDEILFGDAYDMQDYEHPFRCSSSSGENPFVMLSVGSTQSAFIRHYERPIKPKKRKEK